MKKGIIATLGVLIVGIVWFYYWGSSTTIAAAKYHQLVDYDVEPLQYMLTDTLRAMTYNIGYLSGMTNNESVIPDELMFENNLRRAIELFNNYQPDLVGFQEIDYKSDRSFNRNQGDEIAEKAGYRHGFHSINWDTRYVPFPYGLPKYNFGRVVSGQSLLAKSLLFEEKVTYLEKPEDAPFYYYAFYPERLVQEVDWRVGDDTIKVMNLHLEAFDVKTRKLQAQIVKELYSKYYKDQPILILGDFNSLQAELDDDAMQIIMYSPDIASAIDWIDYGQDSSAFFTFSSVSPYQKIDYILYNQSFIQKVDARVLQDAGDISDHLPVVFDFKLK